MASKTATRKQPLIVKFTKAKVESLTLPKIGQILVWDSDLKGFGLRLTPGARTYIVQAWVKNENVNRRVSLGKHGILTLDEARKRATKAIAKMLEGKDPALEKKRNKFTSLTLRQITDKYLVARRKLKENSKADIEKHLSRAFADWANKPIIAITRDKVLARFKELSDKGPTQANQAFRNLRAIINYAMATYRPGDMPLLSENPVKIISDAKIWNEVQPHTGRIPTNKIGAVWNLLQVLREAPEQTPLTRTIADIVCFLLLTGARWNEAAQLTWDRVNLDESWWYLPDPKNRQPVKFPLSHTAREILNARPQDSNFVFPAEKGGKGYIGTARGVFKKIINLIGGHIAAHDFRRTFRAIAGESQIELWKTKLLMNHKLSGDITISAYTEKQDLTYLNEEINKIADWILHQSVIARDSEKIVSLPGKRGK